VIETLFYWLGAITGFSLLITILSFSFFALHKLWRDWYDEWMKVDPGRLATFMRVAFERGYTDVGETWRVDDRKLKIIDTKEKTGDDSGN